MFFQVKIKKTVGCLRIRRNPKKPNENNLLYVTKITFSILKRCRRSYLIHIHKNLISKISSLISKNLISKISSLKKIFLKNRRVLTQPGGKPQKTK